jgi:hypothetical protein
MAIKIGLLAIVASFSSLLLPAQPLSFETKLPSMFGNVKFVKALETHDTGFLVLFTDRLMKLDRTGKILWTFSSSELPSFSDPGFSPPTPVIGNFIFDSSYIYVFGANHNSSYYSLLNHQGDKLFDTLYLISWNYTQDPFLGLGFCDIAGDEIISLNTTYINLRRDLNTNVYSWDNKCFHYQKVNKFNGSRRDMKTTCLSDSNENLVNVVKLNTQDKGYLINVEYENWNDFNYNPRNKLLRIDSSGNILSVKDMFPLDVFPKQNEQRIDEFGPIYDPELFEGKYYPIKHSFDSAAIGFYLKCKVGFYASEDYVIFYDTNGNLVNWYKFDRYNIQRKSRIKSHINDSFSFYDEIGNKLWSHYYLKPANSWVESFLITSFNGVLLILDAQISNVGNYPHEFYIQHIGPHGWPFGYDPDAPIPPPWNEQDPIHAWFNAQGNLAMPEEMEDWQVTLLNSLGQEVHSGKVLPTGELPLPNNIIPGVYIIRFQSPHTGKVYYLKMGKQF